MGARRAKAAIVFFCLLLLRTTVGEGEPPNRRRNLFGMHNLKDGGPRFDLGMEWTQHLVGRGFVFDWVTDIEPWIEKAFQLNLVPCIRVQEGRGGATPSAGFAANVAWAILNYKIAHPQYADRLVYLQLWNEPSDSRDWVPPAVYADYLVDAHGAIHQAEATAAAAHPGLGLQGTLKTMTGGQNAPLPALPGERWTWDEAFTHNPRAKLAFDVWGTHPYPEATPPHYNLHDGDVFIETSKTIDSYLMDLDVVAKPHGNPPISRRGFPVMITETAYGNKLGISYEGWPKTNRQLASDYNVDAFSNRWFRWPEILAVHPFILANGAWENFAWVSGASASSDANGDGIREPTAPYPQYAAVRQLRVDLETRGMAPAPLVPDRDPKGTLKGTVTRSDTGGPVPYATLSTDGYAFGHVSLYDGGYEIHDVPVGSYTLTVEKNGYRAASRPVSVTAGNATRANFSLLFQGGVSKGLYFVDTPQGQCPGCNLFGSFLAQSFTTARDIHRIKYAAVKPYIDGISLELSIREGRPDGPQVGSSVTATLERGDGAIMIGAEWPDGQEPIVQPESVYFLRAQRADGQGVYCFGSNADPYRSGNAYVGTNALPGVDLYGVIRGLTARTDAAVGSVAGVVENVSNQPLSGARVSAVPGSFATETGADGRYLLPGLPQGSYGLTASLDGYRSEQRPGVEVLGNQSTLVDFTLEEQAAFGTIAGEVKDANGSLLAGAVLSTIPGNFSTVSGANGRFAISRVPPGSYTLSVHRDGYQARDVPGVVVNSGVTATVNVELSSNPPPTPGNLLQNGDFSQGLAGWSAWVQRGALQPSVSAGALQIGSQNHNGGMVQTFSTGGPGREIQIRGFWASSPTVAGSQWAEVLIINGARLPVNGQDVHSGQSDVVLIYKNDTWASPSGWSGPMDSTSPVAKRGGFVAASDRATLILKSGNVGSAVTGTRFDDLVVSGAVPPPPPPPPPPPNGGGFPSLYGITIHPAPSVGPTEVLRKGGSS